MHLSVAVSVLGVTSMLHSAREISKVTRNKRRLRHIHVSIGAYSTKRTTDNTTEKLLIIIKTNYECEVDPIQLTSYLLVIKTKEMHYFSNLFW
jgi:hypothetical protein